MHARGRLWAGRPKGASGGEPPMHLSCNAFYIVGPPPGRGRRPGDKPRGSTTARRACLPLLDAGRPVSVDRIVSEIWPDQPLGSVRDSLYVYVSQPGEGRG